MDDEIGASSIHGEVAEFIDYQKVQPAELIENFTERVRCVGREH